MALILAVAGASITSMSPVEAEEVAEVFGEAQRVTATDVLVRFERGAWGEWLSGGEAPRQLEAEDFEIRLGDTTLPVVSLRRDHDEATEPEPWHWLIWIDAELANPATTRWALSLLGREAESLAALGQVEIILADPQPIRRLAPTSDAQEIERVLADLALAPPGSDALLGQRDGVLRELETLGYQSDPASPGSDAGSAEEEPIRMTPELARALAAEEAQLLRQRHDLLLSHLVDAPVVGARRALLLVTGGFDLDPEPFYDGLVDPGLVKTGPVKTVTSDPVADATPLPGPAEDSPASVDLATIHETTGQTLAAYGWTPIVLVPREPELLVRGWRVGKLLIRPVGPYLELPDLDEDHPSDKFGLREGLRRFGRLFIVGFHAKVEERRDPDRADAYFELARALRAQGHLEDAAETYAQSLYHFANDPRTADQQAQVYAGLGEVLAELGRLREARGAFEAALTLEPDTAEQVGATIAFTRPAEGWQQWAELGDGVLVRDAVALGRVFEDLRGRWRLTYQLGELAPGDLAPLEVTVKEPKLTLHHAQWARVGTPDTVAEMRLRRLLGDSLDDSTQAEGLEVSLVRRGVSGTPSLRVQASPLDPDNLAVDSASAAPAQSPGADSQASAPRVRISWAIEQAAGLRLEHHLVPFHQATGTAPPTLPGSSQEGPRRLAVVVEDLLSGAWGAARVELD